MTPAIGRHFAFTSGNSVILASSDLRWHLLFNQCGLQQIYAISCSSTFILRPRRIIHLLHGDFKLTVESMALKFLNSTKLNSVLLLLHSQFSLPLRHSTFPHYGIGVQQSPLILLPEICTGQARKDTCTLTLLHSPSPFSKLDCDVLKKKMGKGAEKGSAM